MPHDQDANISKIPPIRVSSIDLGRRGGEEESHGLAGFLHIPLLGVRGSDRTQTFGEERVDVGTHVPGQCLYGNCQWRQKWVWGGGHRGRNGAVSFLVFQLLPGVTQIAQPDLCLETRGMNHILHGIFG